MTVHTITGEPRTLTVDFGAVATGNVLVDVAREDGTVLVDDAIAADASGGAYTYTLTAGHVAEVDRLKATFTGTIAGVTRSLVEYVDIAGGYYFLLPELRALPQMADAAKYPDIDLERARAEAEDIIDRNCDTSFVERYRREAHPGTGGRVLVVDQWLQRLLSVTVDGVIVPVADVKAFPRTIELDRQAGWPASTATTRNVVVRYAAAWDPAPEADLRRLALQIARGRLLSQQRTGVPAQAITVTNEAGTFQLGQPTLRYPTGDRVLDVELAGWVDRTYLPGVG